MSATYGTQRECLLAYYKTVSKNHIKGSIHFGNLRKNTAYSLKQGRRDEVVGGLHQVPGLRPNCSKIGVLEGDVQAALCNEYDRERMGWAWMMNGVV